MANETMRIFFPLKIITYPQGEYGLDDSPVDITPAEAVAYEDAIVVSRVCGNTLIANIYFYASGCCPHGTRLIDVGVMNAVEEAGIINMIVELNFCFLPFGVLISACRQRLQAWFVYLFKGCQPVTRHFLKWPVNELRKLLGNSLVDFMETEKLPVP